MIVTKRYLKRGISKIDVVVAVTILAVGARLMISGFDAYNRTTDRARAQHALPQLLDASMAYLAQCRSKGCLERRAAVVRQTPGGTQEGASWWRAPVAVELKQEFKDLTLVRLSTQLSEKDEPVVLEAWLGGRL